MADYSTKAMALKALGFLSTGRDFPPKELSELKFQDISFEPGRVRIRREGGWEAVYPSKALIAWYRVRKDKLAGAEEGETSPFFCDSDGLALTSERIRKLLGEKRRQ